MKVLVVSTPGPGHVKPLLPLVTAFVAQGDDVVVAAAGEVAALVEGTGAAFVAVGHGEDAWFSTLTGRTRGSPGDGLAPERINHYFLPRLFGEIADDDMIDDLIGCARDLDPDLIVFESYAFAAPLVADLLAVPSVHLNLGPLIDPDVVALVDDAVSPLWRSFGRHSPGHAGLYRDLTVEVCPASLEPNRIPSGDQLSMRPAPPPLRAPMVRARPLVYATLGTFFNRSTDLFRDIVRGLSDEDVDVVVTVGSDQDPSDVAPIPSNARVERFIPQADLLPECAVVVHHGGAGTTFGCLAHGVPQVVIPQGADNFINAEMIERVGAGLALRPGYDGASAIRDAVRHVINDTRFREASRRVADEIGVMPDPRVVAQWIRDRLDVRTG